MCFTFRFICYRIILYCSEYGTVVLFYYSRDLKDIYCLGLVILQLPNNNFTCAFAGQIKEAVLNGVSLEDDKREQFNKIQQVCLYEN